jgi:septum formation protein
MMKPIKQPLILASVSPRRRILMRRAGLKFKIIPSQVSENHPPLSPARLVKFLALKKAVSVAKNNPRAWVLGADTLVFVNGEKIGKPRNAKDAARILRLQSGRWQKVYTGVALVGEGGKKRKLGVCVSRVKMRELTPADINWAVRHHLDKAGAYAVQQKNDPFVQEIVGDFDNVVGLPMRIVRKLLLS